MIQEATKNEMTIQEIISNTEKELREAALLLEAAGGKLGAFAHDAMVPNVAPGCLEDACLNLVELSKHLRERLAELKGWVRS